MEDHPDIVVQDLGRRTFDGVETIGFQVKDPVATINLWAESVTATPKRIELTVGGSGFVFKNFEFDAPVTASQVSMEVPEGYTLAEKTVDMGEGTEDDLIITLGLWAKDIRSGSFPDQLSVQGLMQLLPEVTATLRQMDLSEKKRGDLGMHFGRACVFLQLLNTRGEWHYAGAGVQFGDKTSAVFWYRQADAKTYRVIYGDLHVEEVALDQLPQ